MYMYTLVSFLSRCNCLFIVSSNFDRKEDVVSLQHATLVKRLECMAYGTQHLLAHQVSGVQKEIVKG